MKAKLRQQYPWLVAAAAFFLVACAMGLENNLYSLYLIPVTEALGVSRAAFSSAQSVRCLAALVSNLLFGALYRRFGFRRPALLCIALVTASYVWYAGAHDLVAFYAGALVFGLGESFLNTAGVARLTDSWFVRHKGAVLGAVMAASGLGGAVLGVTLETAIRAFGWRESFLLGAGLMAAAGVLVLIIVRDHPKQLGLQPVRGEEAQKKRPARAGCAAWEGLSMRRLLRRPYFYLTALSVFLCSVCTYGAYPIVTAHLQDQGMSAAFAASMYSLMMLLLAAAKVIVGALSDRFGAHRAMTACIVCNILGTALLAVTKAPWQAALMTVLMGFALCTQTFAQPLLAAELFGTQAHAATLGILLAMVSAGGLIAPPIINASFDVLGSYTPSLLVLTGLTALVLVMFLCCVRAAMRERQKTAPQTEK